MFKKSGKICVAVLAALTLSAGNNSFAACTDLIVDQYNGDGEFSQSIRSNVHGVAFSSVGGGIMLPTFGVIAAGTGAGMVAIGAVSTTVVAPAEVKETLSSTLAKGLDPSQDYAFRILGSSTITTNNIDPNLASFIKNVKREMGKDRSAVIPTDDEIIRAIETVNHDLSACIDGDGEVYVPEKSDLLKTVVDYLNY